MLRPPKDLTDDRAWFWYSIRYYLFLTACALMLLTDVFVGVKWLLNIQ